MSMLKNFDLRKTEHFHLNSIKITSLTELSQAQNFFFENEICVFLAFFFTCLIFQKFQKFDLGRIIKMKVFKNNFLFQKLALSGLL